MLRATQPPRWDGSAPLANSERRTPLSAGHQQQLRTGKSHPNKAMALKAALAPAINSNPTTGCFRTHTHRKQNPTANGFNTAMNGAACASPAPGWIQAPEGRHWTKPPYSDGVGRKEYCQLWPSMLLCLQNSVCLQPEHDSEEHKKRDRRMRTGR